MKKLLVVIIIAFNASTLLANTNIKSLENINKAIELIKVGCASGEKIDIKVTGNGNISFIKKGIDGEISLTKEEINGVVKGTNEKLRVKENSEIRKCMQQYVPDILDSLLKSRAKNKLTEDNYYYLTSRDIPLGIPVSILNGDPLLIVYKVSEGYGRKKKARLRIEIPHRNNYEFYLGIGENGKFEYRDKIYKVKIDHIDLQEQNVTLSLVKYKDIKRKDKK